MFSMTSSAIFVLALASNALAATLPAVTGRALAANAPGVVLVGAAKPTTAADSTVTAAPMVARDLAAPPASMIINVINSHTSPVTTVHVQDPSVPSPVAGNVDPGVLEVGASGSIAVPPNWIGNIALADAANPITGDDTLIEANFVVAAEYGFGVPDVDVSYVNGFSVPVTCSCDGAGVVSGCNKDLYALNNCDTSNNQGACVNPLRADSGVTSASTFFAPCQNAAWTFVNDGAADAWSRCQSGVITCCVGTACPGNPKQSP